MLIRVLLFGMIGMIVLHGIIHLMGFVAYWPLAKVGDLSYKTTIGPRWDIGPKGMRLFSVFWLIAAVGIVAGAVAYIFEFGWWAELMWLSLALSVMITVLDWDKAYRGAIISCVILFGLLIVFGLRFWPEPLVDFPHQSSELVTQPLSNDLPQPVSRFYEVAVGDDIPILESAVISARGTTRVAGVTFPARMRFTHDAGQGYRHYIEATWFGFPIMKVNERYLDQDAVMELPFGTVENEPKVNQAANLGLWGESVWLSPIFLTDPRVRWEPIDSHSARLIVPFEDTEDAFTVEFDQETGLINSLEAFRYREVDQDKILWRLEVIEWETFDGMMVPSVATATWIDEGTPWLVVNVEDIAFNVEVEEYIQARGP